MAATIISILMIGVVTHLRGGLMAWRRTSTEMDQLQRTRVAWDTLERDVTNAVDLDPSPGRSLQPRFVFETGKLAFFTVRESARREAAGRDVWFVTYRVQDGQLIRARQTLREALADAKHLSAAPGVPTVLMNAVAGWSIQYGYRPADQAQRQLAWLSEWKYLNKLPRLVKVTIALASAGGSGTSLTRLLVVQSGVLEQIPAEGGS